MAEESLQVAHPHPSSPKTARWDRAQGSTQAVSQDAPYTYVSLPFVPLKSPRCSQSGGMDERILSPRPPGRVGHDLWGQTNCFHPDSAT